MKRTKRLFPRQRSARSSPHAASAVSSNASSSGIPRGRIPKSPSSAKRNAHPDWRGSELQLFQKLAHSLLAGESVGITTKVRALPGSFRCSILGTHARRNTRVRPFSMPSARSLAGTRRARRTGREAKAMRPNEGVVNEGRHDERWRSAERSQINERRVLKIARVSFHRDAGDN